MQQINVSLIPVFSLIFHFVQLLRDSLKIQLSVYRYNFFYCRIDTKPHFAFVKASLQNINPVLIVFIVLSCAFVVYL